MIPFLGCFPNVVHMIWVENGERGGPKFGAFILMPTRSERSNFSIYRRMKASEKNREGEKFQIRSEIRHYLKNILGMEKDIVLTKIFCIV